MPNKEHVKREPGSRQQGSVETEISWRRRFRKQVGDGTKGDSQNGDGMWCMPCSLPADAIHLSESQQRELEFQREKKRKRLVEEIISQTAPEVREGCELANMVDAEKKRR